jgi:hypothetical protein
MNNCPYCGSTQLQGETKGIFSKSVITFCLSCGQQWNATFMQDVKTLTTQCFKTFCLNTSSLQCSKFPQVHTYCDSHGYKDGDKCPSGLCGGRLSRG